MHSDLWHSMRSTGPITVGVVACGEEKLSHATPAKHLYSSRHFQLCRAYVRQRCEAWCILSAKHRVLHPNEVIEPYNERVSGGARQIGKPGFWHHRTAHELRSIFSTEERPVHFYVLCGTTYRAVFDRWGADCRLFAGDGGVAYPLKSLGIGEQDAWLMEQTKYRGHGGPSHRASGQQRRVPAAVSTA